MIEKIIADTGVLIGLLSQRDHKHDWCVKKANSLKPPFYTCEAVITEVCHLLRESPNGNRGVLSMISSGLIAIDFSLHEESERVRSLMKKYSDLPMDFADACVVRMSELIEDSVVFTLDSDFLVYRQIRNKRIPLITPKN